MNKINKIVALLVIIASCFSSCELKNELEGKYNLKANEGLLNLNLVPKSVQTRASITDGMDVNTFQVEIVDATTDAVVRAYASYDKLKEALPVILPVGSYKIVARSCELQEASRTPYFAGKTNIDVKQGVESKAEVVCKLGTVKVDLAFSDGFLNAFADDYSIGITNGNGGVIYFTKDQLSSVYLNVPPGALSIKIDAKVTDKTTGRDIETNYTVTKPDGEELIGGDAFNVVIKPTEEGGGTNPDVPGEPSKPTVGLKLDIDLTMEETGITVKVPTECIEESKPEEPTDPEEPVVGEPEIIGADRTVLVNKGSQSPTVQITMKASAGIKNLFVLIESTNVDFQEIIEMMGLDKKFDLANLGDLKDLVENDFDNGGIGLLPSGTVIKGEKEFVFDISSFIPLLSGFGIGNHSFKLQLVDANEKQTSEVVLSVVVEEEVWE